MTVRRLVAAAAVLLAVGCGGSSKKSSSGGRTIAYSGPTTTAALSATTTNKQAIAGGFAGMAQGFAGGAGGMSEMASMFGAGAHQKLATVQNALLIAADARHQPALASVAGAVTSNTQPCGNGSTGSGTMTTSQNDADGNPNTTTSGDYVEVSYAACNYGYGAGMNGSFRLTITTTSGDDFVADAASITRSASFGLTLSFNDFLTIYEDGSWDGSDGDMTISFASDVTAQTITFGISGTSLASAYGTGDTVEGASMITATAGQSGYHDTAVQVYAGMGTPSAYATENRWDMDARVCATELGGCLDVVTNPVFSQLTSDQYPRSGALRITDGTDWIQVEATSAATGACTLSWSIDGTPGSEVTTWAALEAASNAGP